MGHKAVDCRYRGSDSHRDEAGSPNVDTVAGPTGRGRPATCYTCGKEGHRSPDCAGKQGRSGDTGVKKETETAHMHYITCNREEKCG